MRLLAAWRNYRKIRARLIRGQVRQERERMLASGVDWLSVSGTLKWKLQDLALAVADIWAPPR